VLGGGIDGGRGDVVGAAPDVDLLSAVFLDGFLLVQALEGTVVSLFEFERRKGGEENTEKVMLGVCGRAEEDKGCVLNFE
jgi:hypothetical protein